MRHARADHVIARLLLLEHEPHRFDVIRSVAPVPAGVEIAQIELLLEPELDVRYGAGDLPVSRNIGSVFGDVEAHAHMALRAKIIDLIGPYFVQKFEEAGSVGEVGKMKEEPRILFVEIAIDSLHPLGVEAAGPPLEPVYLV